MRSPQAIDDGVVEQPSVGQARLADLLLDPAAEVAPEPLADRGAETLLGAMRDTRRQKLGRDALEQVFADAVAYLHRCWKRQRELDQVVIEERFARLHGRGHGHLVDS